MTRQELYRRLAEHSDGLLALLDDLRAAEPEEHLVEFGAIFVCSAGLAALLVGTDEGEPEPVSHEEECAANDQAIAQLVEAGLLEVVPDRSEP